MPVKRFISRSVSNISFIAHNKLAFVGGGLGISPYQKVNVFDAFTYQTTLLCLKLSVIGQGQSSNLVRSYFYKPLSNFNNSTKHVLSVMGHASLVNTNILNCLLGSTNAMQLTSLNNIKETATSPTYTASTFLIKHGGLSKPLSTQPWVTDRKGLRSKEQPTLPQTGNLNTYIESQLFHNCLQAYLIYRNSLHQRFATSRKASLILSFETHFTRLSRLPIFLGLRRRPFGSGIKAPNFSSSDVYMRNHSQNYITDFLNPVQTSSLTYWARKTPYKPYLMRPVTLPDLQLRLSKFGPKIKPIVGRKPFILNEVSLMRKSPISRYGIVSRVLLRYLTLLNNYSKVKLLKQPKSYNLSTTLKQQIHIRRKLLTCNKNIVARFHWYKQVRRLIYLRPNFNAKHSKNRSKIRLTLGRIVRSLK